MTTNSHLIEAQYRDDCTYPTLGEMLPDYVVELLGDSASAAVEDHLLDCLHCRETYLKMLRIDAPRRRDAAAPGGVPARASEATPAPTGRNVIRMADFVRERRRRP